MRIFETHAHLDFEQFNHDREAVIQSCFKAGVERIINVGVDAKSTENGIKLSERYPQIKASAGYHPSEVGKYNERVLRDLLSHKNVVAVGEIGLDYYRHYHPIALQKRVFEHQILMAVELGLPIICHDRQADEDCYQMLKKYSAPNVVFHCFAGDVAFAEKVLAMGWYISITGVITYKNSNLSTVVPIVPRDKLMIETDCPYLPPVPHRGKRNSPEYLVYVVQKIADILHVSPNEVAEQTYENACRFFKV